MIRQHGDLEAPRLELLPGVTRSAALLVLGALVLQLGFVFSYVGAFHSPTLRDAPIGVVAPAGAPPGAAQSVADKLNGLDGGPVDAAAYPDEDSARRAIADRDIAGAFLVGAQNSDTLLVTTAEGGTLSAALEEAITRIDAGQQRTVTTKDVLPSGDEDNQGLSAFYLAVGWLVGGYLVAALLGVSSGYGSSTRRRGGVRLGALALYSVLSGIGGAVIVGPLLGALPGHFVALSALGALLVFAVGATTMALQVWTGLIGIGLAIGLYVVLGNPSAGGAYPAPLLPPFWAAIGPYLPPGAGTSGVRGIIYFSGAGTGSAATVLAVYAVVGVVVTLLGAGRSREAKKTAAEQERTQALE
ncbi:MAG: DUF3533 domain-containing protein [Nocardioidaceae bacterium]|nr:DUF3533 domain-containing protein [Nocardioidaceae bacterium]